MADLTDSIRARTDLLEFSSSVIEPNGGFTGVIVLPDCITGLTVFVARFRRAPMTLPSPDVASTDIDAVF